MSDVIFVKGCTDIDQLTQLANPSLSHSNDRTAFFYNPPGDSQIYHITCELSNKNVDPLSDHTFYYNIDDNSFYQITCRLISHSLIVQFLNKKIYGIEHKQGEEPQQDYLTFSKFQRDNLEFHLKGFFLNRLTPKQINKSSNSNDAIIVQPKL
ncbi:uncharacterized protein OCT59_017011 [Rhizophagus irregularis]|uniref:Uncharacterized protein n=2 Tax=Rhizophagus irregularis TaxID=588596 RepID=A0A015J6M5_RHIIW|nr:hypothetical protein GLOIN_2v1602252 [Rhizophagus irregularis DAOM 181602=DAOM 197198]EXX65167.1 hypothetical protein RirG_135890 [Rhizophagus irregularis DAOM 197198w]UZO24717.1 hypothetical protein OCT59_017011 [Rhizophagus irregularis]POG71746.1 hypothetical protein GLOIN_2v1602252 [Rhizophagus irregularis DAOM 181602=DAOM 197198]CAG8565853.1 3955_t:CDS:1 [Rhizophagus irregularis]GBC14637.2 hypothetical protein GLOIN_2v1602252 [Rhizophagus irregularis DAOM 181602=DAOM 197198]|eukprot:XP_025178612.1 hypothetical protein GLOIN_2v1602252 [Rhizophagus irregularis DAOM 181602=DAOM 197198]